MVGSSAMSRSGLVIRAIAIITRWRMPPDSWCGYSRTILSALGMPTISSIWIVRRSASAFVTSVWVKSASATCTPTALTGLSEVMGS